ncbi:MAG: N-6 DNA methylase [Blastocatellia bacterium]|nr:N-6 DNA methylase [Blastocatellia bacterium]
MARTSKMNMIMHGDGHGGVHHHDGFLNVNGVFEGRFDIILTNPPFGANVEPSEMVHEADVTVSGALAKRYTDDYGPLYSDALARTRAAVGKPIASSLICRKRREQDQDGNSFHRKLPRTAQARRTRRCPAGRYLQQSLARLCARVLRKPRLHPRSGEPAARNVLVLRRERESVSSFPAKIHSERAGRFRQKARQGARGDRGEARAGNREGNNAAE